MKKSAKRCSNQITAKQQIIFRINLGKKDLRNNLPWKSLSSKIFHNKYINLVLRHFKNLDLEIIENMLTDQLTYVMAGCGERFSSHAQEDGIIFALYKTKESPNNCITEYCLESSSLSFQQGSSFFSVQAAITYFFFRRKELLLLEQSGCDVPMPEPFCLSCFSPQTD